MPAQAKITATAYLRDQPMFDSRNKKVQWTTESSTDLSADALGEAVALCLNLAWKMGVDPAVTAGFHIRVIFS